MRFTPGRGAAQVRISLGTRDEIEAIARAREILVTARRDTAEAMESCEWEVARYLEALKAAGMAASTLEARGYILRRFVRDVGARTPREVTGAVVAKWFERRRKHHEHTAAAYLQVVRLWVRHLVTTGRLTVDPLVGVKAPKLAMRVRKVVLSATDARRLLAACDRRPVPRVRGHERKIGSRRKTFRDERLKFAVFCGLHLGLRKLEVIEARRSWFDLEAGLVHVQATGTFQPKDRDNRTIPLTDEFRDWLRGYMKRLPKEAVFMLAPSVTHGRARYRFDFRKAFEALKRACGLEHVTFHDLRRTFASLLVSRGVSIYKVAKWMGDLVEVVENTYGHLVPPDDEINAAWS